MNICCIESRISLQLPTAQFGETTLSTLQSTSASAPWQWAVEFCGARWVSCCICYIFKELLVGICLVGHEGLRAFLRVGAPDLEPGQFGTTVSRMCLPGLRLKLSSLVSWHVRNGLLELEIPWSSQIISWIFFCRPFLHEFSQEFVTLAMSNLAVWKISAACFCWDFFW